MLMTLAFFASNCGKTEEPIDLEDDNDNPAYVDLGLPSGTLWATCNVGANAPEERGHFFAWGETKPKDSYDWTTYRYCKGGPDQLTKYCSHFASGYEGFTDYLTTLQPEDDAATANLGEEWCTPLKEDWQELFDHTTQEWTTLNGEEGRRFTGSNGNSIFVPVAGMFPSIPHTCYQGHYWSSSRNADHSNWAVAIYFQEDTYWMVSHDRKEDYLIRPICLVIKN